MSRLYERDVFDRAHTSLGLPGLGSFVPHPPPNALLLWPLARLPAGAAKAAWTLLLAAAYVGAVVLMARGIGVDATTAAFMGVVPTAALGNALAYGQPYPLLLLLACASLWAARRGRWATAGALLAPVMVLKLYGALFIGLFLLGRRWRALAGLSGAALASAAMSVAVLGTDIHVAYVREILPFALDGRVQDPYSMSWQSGASLSRRLFAFEPDLNPRPWIHAPVFADALARAIAAALAALTVLAAAGMPTVAGQWAMMLTGALAVSPLPATYHFVLLVLPAAVAFDAARGRAERIAIVASFAFAASSLPHYFMRWGEGAGNLVAQPRFFAVVTLLVIVARPALCSRRVGIAAASGLTVAAVSWPTFGHAPPSEPAWTRLPAGGYLQAAPITCGRDHAWLAVAHNQYVVASSDGSRLPVDAPPRVPACVGGRVRALPPPAAAEPAWARFGAPARHVRVSPDGWWVVAQVFREGSWDVEVMARDGRIVAVTRDTANEVEPSWSADGHAVLFASDRGRGLGSTAIYSAPFEGIEGRARDAGEIGDGIEQLRRQHGLGEMALKAGLEQPGAIGRGSERGHGRRGREAALLGR